jgi:ATP-dependent DNA helicase DinG
VFSRYLSHFPQEYNPSDQQIKLIKGVERAFNRGKKFVICCAPTGTGKSFLAKTLAGISSPATDKFKESIQSYSAYKQDFAGNYISEIDCLSQPPFGTFALTITKSLQDQYLKLFPDTDILKGKSNYICDVDPHFDVETAPCVLVPKIRDECWEKNRCPYYNARNSALLSRFAVLNYKMFLALPSHVKRKNFIICDEASELEDELIKQYSAEINYDRLRAYGVDCKTLITDSKDKVRTWLCENIFQISEQINTLINRVNKKHRTLSQPEKIKLQYLKNAHNSLTTVDTLWRDCEYIIDKDIKKVLLTPLRADKLTKFIFNHADNVLLMSATIIDHKNFAKTLGITDYEYVEVESDFNPEKSPIYVSSQNKLNYKNLTNILPAICEQIKTIIDHHKNEKGIIHTHSKDITNFIKTKLEGNKRFLFRDETANNEAILKEHYETDFPTILVSPSLSFGVDLKDSLARFQIIIKLPYPPLSSKHIKKLFDTDKDWYENKMLNALVQACGRATRSKNDFSTTYILDGNIVNALKRTKHKLPKSFIDRIC